MLDTNEDLGGLVHANFVGALALHSYQRDTALGTNVSQRTRGLLWYYRKLQQTETARFAQAVFYKGVIDDARREIKAIVTSAETADDKRALLLKATMLQGKLEAAVTLLEKLERGDNANNV